MADINRGNDKAASTTPQGKTLEQWVDGLFQYLDQMKSSIEAKAKGTTIPDKGSGRGSAQAPTHVGERGPGAIAGPRGVAISQDAAPETNLIWSAFNKLNGEAMSSGKAPGLKASFNQVNGKR